MLSRNSVRKNSEDSSTKGRLGKPLMEKYSTKRENAYLILPLFQRCMDIPVNAILANAYNYEGSSSFQLDISQLQTGMPLKNQLWF